MQIFALFIFFVSVFWILYVYILYPLFLLGLGSLRGRQTYPAQPDKVLPSISILIPAYNEEKVIARKLETTLALDYPEDKLSITVVSDKSCDRTDEIVKSFCDARIHFIRNETQKGKIATLSELASKDSAQIVIITDANAIFETNALKKLVAPFQDSAIGIVNGNKVLKRTETMVGEGEGVYWIYETHLKQADSDIFSNAFVTGAMTAIRQELFIPIPGYLEFDHILPLHVVNKGFRVAFAMDARFFEETAPSSMAEWNVRVRNAVRGFCMVLLMGRYLNLFKHPWFVLHIYSRKVLRWLVALPMAGILISSFLLLNIGFFRLTILAQIIFYGAALTAFGLDRIGRKQGLLALPFYFCLVNAASLVGFFRALQGQRMAVWGTGR